MPQGILARRGPDHEFQSDIFGTARLAWPCLQRRPRESCCRLAVFRDGQHFAGIQTGDDLLQMRLRVFDITSHWMAADFNVPLEVDYTRLSEKTR
jgi:hypothetical protein